MNETMIIKASVVASGIILAGVLLGLWLYGIDLATVFLGTPWGSSLQQTRGAIALEGAIVFITLAFGGLFVGGIMALIKR